jgi:hypothetical protein
MIRTVIALSLAAAAATAPRAEEPTLAIVLDRAATYVADFQRELATIVGEEHYVQRWTWAGPRKGSAPQERRELRADLLMVKPAASREWMAYRDVFEVDGRPVRDRDDRLPELFLKPSQTADQQIGQILAASARYNIGDIQRNVNTPLFSLLFLESANHHRFTFTRAKEPTLRAVEPGDSRPGVFRVSTEVWAVAYREKESGTMIRTGPNAKKDLPARGTFWIEPATGRVMMSELVTENRQLRATIDVSFQSEPLFGMFVPIEMHELYESRDRGRSRIEAVATYSQFRRLEK